MAETAPAPEVLDRVARAFDGFGRPWALCGGWAVDAWLGRQTRAHLDVDLWIHREDQRTLHGYLRDGWLLNGHDPHDDDSVHAWDGHALELPAHVHARGHDLNLDVQLNAVERGELVLRAQPRVTIPMPRATATSPWGLPTLAPEAVLFFKLTTPIRPHDRADIDILLPRLGAEQRRWLDGAVAVAGST